ncbi:uncharacterized protein LOC135378701 isoform X2 [Ornithodoros turicata]
MFPCKTNSNMDQEKSPQDEDIRRKIHEAIEKKDHVQVQECLRAAPHLRLWLHPSTEKSAMYRAVKEKAFYIYSLLLSHNSDFKSEKERRCFDHLNRIQRRELQRQRKFVTKYEDSYVNQLKRRTASQTNIPEFATKVDHILHVLDSIELLRPILQVSALAHHLNIRFDFERSDVQPMIGCRNRSNYGITDYAAEEIFIAAGSLPLNEVIGTLAHELCHFALHAVYRNGGKPYHSHVMERKLNYQKIIGQIEKRKEKLDEILRLALDYDEEEEMIVRVPHILALHSIPGQGIEVLRTQTPELLQFYQQYIVPDLVAHSLIASPSKDAQNIMTENIRLDKARNTEALGVVFGEPLERLNTENVPLLVLAGPEVSLLEILVHDYVKSTGLSYIFFDASQYDETLEDVLVVNKCNLVLITCDDREKFCKILKVLREISDVVGTKVILIVREDEKAHFVEKVRTDQFFSSKYNVADVDTAHMKNITLECKDRIRKASRIRFQGCNSRFELQDVIDFDNFSAFIDPSTFLGLCKTPDIVVGPTPCGLKHDVGETYVKRKLKRFTEVNEAKLHSPSDAFAFYGCPAETVSKFLPPHQRVQKSWCCGNFERFVLHNDIEQHEYMVKAYLQNNKVIHLLQYSEIPGISGKTHSKCPGRFPFMEVVYHDEDDLLQLPEKVVVVCGAPGIGKSALASRLSEELKKHAGTKRCVLHVDLPNKVESVGTETDAGYLLHLADLCGVQKTGLEFFLFQQSVQNGIPFEIFIIFDAFDEINRHWRNYILKLVEYLTTTQVSKTFIMSRTIFKTVIQDTIRTIPFELAPFSYSDNVDYMIKHWSANGMTGVSYEELRTRAELVLQPYLVAMGFPNTPLKIPMFTRIIAQLEQNSEFHEEASFRKSTNIFDIYRTFADCKYETYQKQKLQLKLNTFASAGEYAEKTTEKEFYHVLGLLAVNAIFDDELIETLTERSVLEPGGPLMRDVADGLIGHGIVDGLHDGNPTFIHRTIAEFFAAHFLFCKIKKAGSNISMLVTAVLGLYVESNYEQVVMFLDHFATESFPLHSAIIRGDTSSLTGIREEDVYELDHLDRTLLHVAALHADPATLKALPVNESPIRKDKLGMTPIMYAEKLREGSVFDIICDCFSNASSDLAEEFPTAFRNATTEKSLRKSVFYEVVKANRYSPLRLLLSGLCRKRSECRQGINPDLVDVDTIRDEEGRTLLFYANTTAVLELLLPYCDLLAIDKYGYTVLHYRITWHQQKSPSSLGTIAFEEVEFLFLHSTADFRKSWETTHFQQTTEEVETKLVKLLLLRSLRSPAATWRSMLLQSSCQLHVINLLLPHALMCNPAVNTVFSPYSSDKSKATGGAQLDLWRPGSQLLYYSPQKICEVVQRSHDTQLEKLKVLVPYFETGDLIKYTMQFISSDILYEAKNLAVLKHVLLRFDTLFTDKDDYAALHLCARLGKVDEIKMLLPHLNLFVTDKEGRSASQLSCVASRKEVTDLFDRWTMKTKKAGQCAP